MALRSKDLMIGDWYAFRGHPYQCTASDIASLAECEEKGAPTDISEIPLTPEILEKNGFGFTKNNNTDSAWNGWWIYEGLELAVANLNKEGNWPCFINIYDSNILCEYVHQLQHALRLCGIEKEIEL